MPCEGLKAILFLIDCYSGLSWTPLFSYSSCANLHRSIS